MSIDNVDTITTDTDTDEVASSPTPAADKQLRLASRAAAIWALLYCLYRGYYAAGGRLGMFGTPISQTQWRQVNAVGAAILLVAAITPHAMLLLCRHRAARPTLLVLCWIVAVGCIMHALVDMTQCVLSLTGRITIDRPIWSSIDTRQADLQDLLFNEPWFLIEGLLWATIGWLAGIGSRPRGRRWVATGLFAIAALLAVGLLSATGVIDTFIVA